MGFVLLNQAHMTRMLDYQIRVYDSHLKQGIGNFMVLVKESAPDFIVGNNDPKRFWRQVSHPNKVTNRRGILKWMLTEGKTHNSNELFKNRQREISRTDSSILKSMHGKIEGKGGGMNVGTWSSSVKNDSAPLRALMKMQNRARQRRGFGVAEGDEFDYYTNPVNKKSLTELKKSMTMRLVHERKGRAFLAPSHNKNIRLLFPLIKKAFGPMARTFNMDK